MFDISTILMGYSINMAISFLVMTLLWLTNCKQMSGLNHWALFFLLLFCSTQLLSHRSALPSVVGVTFGNLFSFLSLIVLIEGLTVFFRLANPRFKINLGLLIFFVTIHAYFTFFYPSFLFRQATATTFLIILSAQCIWIVMIKKKELSPLSSILLIAVFILFIGVSGILVLVDVMLLSGTVYINPGKITAFLFFSYQFLSILLSFGLFLLVNHRLVKAREEYIIQLKNTEDQLRIHYQAVQHSGSSIILTDQEGIIQYVNPAFSRITGYSSEEVVGKKPSILKSGFHAPSFYKSLWETITGGYVWRGEIVNKNKDGDYYWESANIAPVIDKYGRSTHFVGIKEDITARKEVEAKLTSAKESAENANQAKSDFLANISHELRTPMHHILAYASFGLKKFGSVEPDKIYNYFFRINDSGKKLMFLLDDLLDLSKLESGQMDYCMRREDLIEMIDDAIVECLSYSGNRSIQIERVPSQNLSIVECDKNRLNQVLSNLLTNATRYSPDGKRVSISVTEINQGNENSISAVKVSVKDEGQGIPAGELEDIFDKFKQSSRTKTKSGGTGLGLAICRNIIEAHHGRIWAENNPRVGATFSFIIPYKQAYSSKGYQN